MGSVVRVRWEEAAGPAAPRHQEFTQALAQSAATLLRAAGLHGHKYAIDAMLCATALAQPGRVTILTSDVEDITMLTTDHPRVTAEKI